MQHSFPDAVNMQLFYTLRFLETLVSLMLVSVFVINAFDIDIFPQKCLKL